jgi:hypothetical protein
MTFREAEAGQPWRIKRGLALLPESHGVDRATRGNFRHGGRRVAAAYYYAAAP